jgi:hypothetical protein
MPRTTIDLESALLRELKHRAAESGESMSRTVSRLLRIALQKVEPQRRRGRRIRWKVVPGGRPAPGFDPASRDYLDQLDETA